MPSSQFKIFTSNDLGAPQLNGFSGSLIDVLDYCLISGSGWLQPSASVHFSSSVNNIGIYQQPSGSGCILYVNDARPNATSLGQEAWVTGWENLTTMSVPCGTGSAQFPMFGQLLVSGHYVVRKSAAATSVQRQWVMFVDSYTFYFFNKSGDTADTYTSLFFGDVYSFVGPTDRIKCMISSRTAENVGNATSQDQNDMIVLPSLTTITTAGNAGYNMVMGRNAGGRYVSEYVGKMGAYDYVGTSVPSNGYMPMAGVLHSGDGQMHMRPISIWSPGNGLRGRMRGMYSIPVAYSRFPDGSVFNATGEFAGKTFMIINKGYNSGFWVIEISNTVETN
jgi:hypothetical protein